MSKKNVFKIPYIGIDSHQDYDLLYGPNGEYSVVINLNNPVQQYSGASEAYDEFHSIYSNIIKILGGGYLIQKQDIISKSAYPYIPAEEYLQDKYNRHFAGRKALKIRTCLSLTRLVKNSSLYVHDAGQLRDFMQKVDKVLEVLRSAGTSPKVLPEKEINHLIKQILSMDFSEGPVVLNNYMPTDTQVNMGSVSIRSLNLIDIDSIDLPQNLSTHRELSDNESVKGFPIDLFSFLLKVPEFQSILFNQVIEIPNQAYTLRKLALKRKRHSGIPDPANDLCVEDIDLLLKDVARNNQVLVNAHYNIIIAAEKEQLQKSCNFVESALFHLGITPCKSAYNQLELFRTALPGNGIELQDYDWFLTTSDAAICLMFKESLPVDDPSDFLIRFTDRQGIPLGIDLSDLPLAQNRMSNRSRFVLGGSGTGKSFFMNSVIEQYMLYNMDVVIIDTGHSYSGLCSYYNGKYITYSEKEPITMNPFAITPEEYNIEKKDFLVTLITLLWKGTGGSVSQIESDVITQLISTYYTQYFYGRPLFDGHSAKAIPELSFNSFYEYALATIPLIKEAEQIPFNLEEFRYVLKKFYKGGEYDRMLNQNVDQSLFDEPFIVFEIDNIKESNLFPIVTLIIMDVFLQKMRHRSDRRKALICEEAWKAIASPIMASYLLYLYKTVRKFWGEAIVVTQELADILGNPIVKDSIIGNSGTICLLDQSNFKDNYDEIAKLLSISDTERKKIFTVNQLDNKEGRSRFKEVYIRRGMTGEVYGVEVSAAQYLTYTTEKPEKSAVERYTRHFGTYPAGVDAFLSDLDKSGLSLGRFVTQVNSKEIFNLQNS
ncbi:TraG family conjugative transposon ATPase [Pedobacter hiemivivus]|uniref:TraG family conjugative transposon ATPase n=1 Tax=Pedobacter hiemivivus TaxID=2530454 RepID=A0A4R0NIU8_9SPHI|nr:TraG family conjugative transposon ATPase [Pedobacter hiemivivus]TCC98784.1 TraG family conjugative transposon ATPase [Pedobacter hiemivivus]